MESRSFAVSHLAVMSKISIHPGIPVGYKDQLPETSKWCYRYQTRMWLSITLRCQNSEPAVMKDAPDIFFYCTLFIHIFLIHSSRNPVIISQIIIIQIVLTHTSPNQTLLDNEHNKLPHYSFPITQVVIFVLYSQLSL